MTLERGLPCGEEGSVVARTVSILDSDLEPVISTHFLSADWLEMILLETVWQVLLTVISHQARLGRDGEGDWVSRQKRDLNSLIVFLRSLFETSRMYGSSNGVIGKFHAFTRLISVFMVSLRGSLPNCIIFSYISG
jgi:hypothetical protein